MPKRKREDSGLEENLTKWRKELAHGLYLAKCFERQRLSKRLREADADKKGRLEKEILVLKSLDIQQAAHAHLCSSLLKIKRIAESPKLPAEIKPTPRHELSEDERIALHNVASALYSRKQVKSVIDEAIKGTCIALGIPVPEKGGGKGKVSEKKKPAAKTPTVKKEERLEGTEDVDGSADDESEDAEEPTFKGPRLLKRKVKENASKEDLESDADDSDTSSGSGFQGFSDSDAEEKMFSKYDDLVGGSSDEDESGEEDDEDDDEDDSSDQIESRSRSLQKLALDDISLSSAASDDSSDSEDDALLPPSKKAKVRAVKPVSFNATSSAFLPSLMGGYVSGSESASDIDIAPSRKNRRGQRARQAIWDKKYGEKAKHHYKETDSRNSGWDMKRGAVDDGGSSGPWKKGIRDPFQKNHLHPQRQQQMQRQAKGKGRGETESGGWRDRDSRDRGFQAEEPPKPKPQRARDDTGPLHPSWAAAKKAKEGGQKVEFQGKKVTFD